MSKMDWQEHNAKAKDLFAEVKVLLQGDENGERSAEDTEKAEKLMAAAKDHRKRGTDLQEIEKAMGQMEAEKKNLTSTGKATGNGGIKSLRDFWVKVAMMGNRNYRGQVPPGLTGLAFADKDEEAAESKASQTWQREIAAGSGEDFKASMAEAVGATGGFLVPVEFLPDLMGVDAERNVIRQRSTVIPMRRRQINVPVLNQTATTAGQPHFFGGIVPQWTEEAAQKDQTDPTFRQISLVAHKLVCYTRASDELLDDEAIGLDAFLRGPLGFAGAIDWEEEFTFLRGTGAGQPLGVINAGATITVARAAVSPSLQLDDVINMVSQIHGDRPMWSISRAQMANLMKLNGPSGNPSFVFIPNAREGIPATLFGFPVQWTEKLPAAGTAGDVVLADWTFYLVGDRQATTIESTQFDRWQNDETSWRSVHRVDGQPWLSSPLTLQDGTFQISPFVILGDKTT